MTDERQQELVAETLEAVARKAGYPDRVVEQPQKPETVSKDHQAEGEFDLMVIGAGSAGFAAAIKGVELGYRVALIEAGLIGGTCVNIGCVPSKTLLRGMEQYHQAGEKRFIGIHTTPNALNWHHVVAQKDELVTEMRQSKYVDVLKAYPEVTFIQGSAHLIADRRVEIAGKAYAPSKIVIATGAKPWAPPIRGLTEAGYLTSTTTINSRSTRTSPKLVSAHSGIAQYVR
jgi:mercuric reductase